MTIQLFTYIIGGMTASTVCKAQSKINFLSHLVLYLNKQVAGYKLSWMAKEQQLLVDEFHCYHVCISKLFIESHC